MVITNYNTIHGEHCFFSNISNILLYYGTGINESIFVLFGGGLSCEYEKRNINNIVKVFLGVRNSNVMTKAFTKLNIAYDIIVDNDDEKVWKDTKKIISESKPLIVKVGTQHLEYNNILKLRSK